MKVEPKAAKKRDTRSRRGRKFVMVEFTPAERAHLEGLVADRGERATLAGTIRDLVAAAPRRMS